MSSMGHNKPIFITDYDDYCTNDPGEASNDSDPREKMALREAQDEDMEDDIDDDELLYDMIEAGVPAPPDGGWGWVIVFASFMCNLIVDGIAYTFGVFLMKFAESFNEGKGNVAWVGSLLSGVYLSVGPIVSALTNKFGCRVVCISGSIIACIGFALSALSQTLPVLMLTYGIIGGIGFGMIYLPAVVCVGYYFESKRALATGLAVCGSGVGTFLFAPFASWLLEITDWRNANLIFSGLIFLCSAFGALMRPLEIARSDDDDMYDDCDDPENAPNSRPRDKPLLQRMAEEKRSYLEKGSLAGSSYFMVQLPDGTMERRMKLPLNVDPGVHSSFNLDQLVPGTPITPCPTLATLPTITEADKIDSVTTPTNKPDELDEDLVVSIPEPIAEEEEEINANKSDEENESESSRPVSNNIPIRRNSEVPSSSAGTTPSSSIPQSYSKSPTKPIPVRLGSTVGSTVMPQRGSMPRNGSAPQFNSGRSLPKNGSVPLFDRMRRQSYKAVPLGSSVTNQQPSSQQTGTKQSKTNLAERKVSMSSFVSSKNNNFGTGDDDYSSLWSKGELAEGGLVFSSSVQHSAPPPRIIRPLSRKDIFYSGSIVHLPEYQSQKSLSSYRQSILNLPRAAGFTTGGEAIDGGEPGEGGGRQQGKCPCFFSGGAFKSALGQMMDFTLLKNPVFLLIAVSNVFGMLGFYVPFVYIIDSAVTSGVDKEQAALLLSIIGITNTIGRILSGIISDLPQVSALFMNNMCILLSGICVALVPFCSNFIAYVAISIFFGLFVSGYVSLTSIILVELLGLENLTNAFGLLILFRGAASIIGAPLAGAVFDAVQTYSIPFYLAGGFLIISSAFSFLVPVAVRYAPAKPLLEPRIVPTTYLEDIPEDLDEQSSPDSPDPQTIPIEKCENVESCL